MKALFLSIFLVLSPLLPQGVWANEPVTRDEVYFKLRSEGHQVMLNEIKVWNRVIHLANEKICEIYEAALWSFNETLSKTDCILEMTERQEIKAFDPAD